MKEFDATMLPPVFDTFTDEEKQTVIQFLEKARHLPAMQILNLINIMANQELDATDVKNIAIILEGAMNEHS